MRLSLLAITGLLLVAGAVFPKQTQLNCWFTEGAIYCWDETNAWRDRFNDRHYSKHWESRNFLYSDINQLYLEVLGREVDSNGFRTFSQRMHKGKSIEWVREKLASSPEAEQAVNQIYLEVLARHADPGGLDTYTKRLRGGWSLDTVRQDILESAEARHRRQLMETTVRG